MKCPRVQFVANQDRLFAGEHCGLLKSTFRGLAQRFLDGERGQVGEPNSEPQVLLEGNNANDDRCVSALGRYIFEEGIGEVVQPLSGFSKTSSGVAIRVLPRSVKKILSFHFGRSGVRKLGAALCFHCD